MIRIIVVGLAALALYVSTCTMTINGFPTIDYAGAKSGLCISR